jgi:hypothetical protein
MTACAFRSRAAVGRAHSETRSPPTGSPCARPSGRAETPGRSSLSASSARNGPSGSDLRNRLHYQHPATASHIPHGSHCGCCRRSRLDADHPENGVLIPPRFTQIRLHLRDGALRGFGGPPKPAGGPNAVRSSLLGGGFALSGNASNPSRARGRSSAFAICLYRIARAW